MTDKNAYFDDLETMSTHERHLLLNARLAEHVDYVCRNSSAVRTILDRAGLTAGDIRTMEDLEKLPITRKVDLIELQKKNPPYGGFLAIPPQDVERVFI